MRNLFLHILSKVSQIRMTKRAKANTINLKVGEARQKDVGKGRARVDSNAMETLGISAGEIIEITGKKSTVAAAWPTDLDDQWSGIIRIDGQTRKNAGVSMDDLVSVKGAEAKPARTISLIPIGTRLEVDPDFSEFVKNRLKGLSLTEGDGVSVVILGSPIQFSVMKVRPKPIVKVDAHTKLSVSSEPIGEKSIGASVTYDEIGGLRHEVQRLREIVELPLRHPEIFQRFGVDPPSGILLHGPPGCGKTLIAKVLASETEANYFTVNGPEIMNKYYGETESRLREIFKEAREASPSIIFLDEIDAIAPKREEVFGDVEKRVVAQLLALMDGLSERGDVIVIGATNRPDSIDPALRRPGRFDREVEIAVPNHKDRQEILNIHTRGMPLESNVDLGKLSQELYGFTGADLRALAREAALHALRRYLPKIDLEADRIPSEILQSMVVKSIDFREARKGIIPTALREVYVEMPSVSWSMIGGMDNLKSDLRENIIWAIRKPEIFQKAGVKPPKGVLIYGPPGCGKTLLARAIATESGANFIAIRGPEILSKWVGESEQAVREIFRKAKSSTPCIIFFDEIDSIARSRASAQDESGVGERVLSQLLTEMDSTQNFSEIFVLGATNRPDLLDMSLLRPGRFDLMFYVPPPDEPARKAILEIIGKKMPLSRDVSMLEIAVMTAGYSGADLESVSRQAAIAALRRDKSKPRITMEDFAHSLSKIKPSLTKDVDDWYKALNKRLTVSLPEGAEKTFYG